MWSGMLSVFTKKNIFGLFLALLIYTVCRLTFLKDLYEWSNGIDVSFIGIITMQNYSSYNFSKIVVVHDLKQDGLAMGLTNQLSRIVQLIEYGCRYNTYISEKSFRLDFAVNTFGILDDIIDIDKTNRNINCTKIIKSSDLFYFPKQKYINGGQLDNHVGYWSFALVNQSNFHKLEFTQSPETTWQSSDKVSLPSKYYAIHFRIEMDILMFVSDSDSGFYFDWLSASRRKNYKTINSYENIMIKNDANSTRILCFIQMYVNLVKEHFTDKSLPIVLATSLGKKDVTNRKIEWILGYFKYRMAALGYTTLIGKATSKYRELNAVADTKMIRGAERCITFHTSTFSTMASMFRTSKMINRSPCVRLVGFKECFK